MAHSESMEAQQRLHSGIQRRGELVDTWTLVTFCWRAHSLWRLARSMYSTWKAACTPRTILGMVYLHAQPQNWSAHIVCIGTGRPRVLCVCALT